MVVVDVDPNHGRFEGRDTEGHANITGSRCRLARALTIPKRAGRRRSAARATSGVASRAVVAGKLVADRT